MPASEPADLSLAPTEVVLRFLESVGRRADAEFYLGLFRGAQERFACIHVDGPVLQDAREAVVLDLRFLAVLGLAPVITLGLFDPTRAAADAAALHAALGAAGVVSTCVAPGPACLAQVTQAARAGQLAIVPFDLAAGSSQAARSALLDALVLGLQVRKVIFLQRRGGLRQAGQRLALVNLSRDFPRLAASPELSRKQQALLAEAHHLVCEATSEPLTVAIASPLDLLRELFTVKGAGTLLRRGARIQTHAAWQGVDTARLAALLTSSFGRPVAPSFFASPPWRVCLDDAYRGAAVLLDARAEGLGAYLSKFAVEREAQGEGIGGDLWDHVTQANPTLFWRSRPDNPVDPWYTRQCDGMHRGADWTVFYKGLPPTQVAAAVTYALAQPVDFSAAGEAAGA